MLDICSDVITIHSTNASANSSQKTSLSNRFLLLLVVARLAFDGTAAQDVSDLAYSLNLTSLHILSMPSSKPQDAPDYISKEWGIWNDRLYGGNESTFDFISDPFSSGKVLSVLYSEGSYRQTPMSQVPTGGLTMYPSLSDSRDSEEVSHALLSYKVAFEEGFQWNKGGKLPGLWSGKEAKDCSGGNQSGDEDCWSVRLMWRADGVGEVYAYLPLENDLCAGAANATLSSGLAVICNDDYGTSLGRGTFNLTIGQYTEVSLYVSQNNPGLSDGSLQLWVDSKPVIRLEDIIFRKKVSSPTRIFFSTFFGGSTSEWASPQGQSSYFKDLQIWLHPAELRTVDAESSGMASRSTAFVSTVFCIALSVFLVLYA